MATKPFEEMLYDELAERARFMFGFEIDELKVLYPNETALRDFLSEAKKVRGMLSVSEPDEAKIGWDETDTKGLDDESKRIVKDILDKRTTKLKEALKTSGGKVSESDVTKVMSEVKRLLDEE